MLLSTFRSCPLGHWSWHREYPVDSNPCNFLPSYLYGKQVVPNLPSTMTSSIATTCHGSDATSQSNDRNNCRVRSVHQGLARPPTPLSAPKKPATEELLPREMLREMLQEMHTFQQTHKNIHKKITEIFRKGDAPTHSNNCGFPVLFTNTAK